MTVLKTELLTQRCCKIWQHNTSKILFSIFSLCSQKVSILIFLSILLWRASQYNVPVMGSLVSAGNDNSWSIDHINSFTQVSLRTSQTGEMYKYRYSDQQPQPGVKIGFYFHLSLRFPRPSGNWRWNVCLGRDSAGTPLSLSLSLSGQNTNFASFLLLNNGNPWGVWLVGLKKVIDHLCLPFLNWRGSYMISRVTDRL